MRLDDATRRLDHACADELRWVLAELVRTARACLGDTFVGAYLVGSFALGHGDRDSDVDFLVAATAIGQLQAEALQAAHARFPDLPIGWAQHLEGSYAPVAELEKPGSAPYSWWYVDNGSKLLQRSSHDDTAVTRWVLRAGGITLDGASANSVVQGVSEHQIRQESLTTVDLWTDSVADGSADIANSWAQQHLVLALCRVLYSVLTGGVTAKLPAGAWGQQTLDRQWRPLIARAMADRGDPWGRVHRAADPALLEPTRDFAAYCRSWADHWRTLHT